MKLRQLSLFLLLVVFANILHAEVLFEGYYKVSQFKKHIGFLVLRHEIDDKTKNFKTTSFIKLAKGGFDMTESYTAVSDSTLIPVSLSYIAVADKKTKTIDAKIKNMKLTGTVTEDKKKTKLDTTLPKGTFFSSALYYLMLQSKEGLKTGSNFDYTALTEEGPVALSGTVSVDKKMVSQGAAQLLKVNNRFAGSDYDNMVNSQGEVISSITPATSIESELVKDPVEALEGIKVTKGTLEKIFGDLPQGKVNSKNK
jgi:hypothetical protein